MKIFSQVYIGIDDVNDNKPQFPASSVTIEIPENTPTGKDIFQVGLSNWAINKRRILELDRLKILHHYFIFKLFLGTRRKLSPATDDDVGNFGVESYKIISGNEENVFRIESNSNELNLIGNP